MIVIFLGILTLDKHGTEQGNDFFVLNFAKKIFAKRFFANEQLLKNAQQLNEKRISAHGETRPGATTGRLGGDQYGVREGSERAGD